MLFNGTTVAFSTKANVWKTRYSFTPTCYMTIDNDFLSSNTKQYSDSLMWRHDQSPIYNTFYDNAMVPSSLEIVSNQNPSAVKIFKALSLESDAKFWTGSVYTNKTRDPFAYQSGDLKSFVQKEGNQYVDMPRSSINSSSNITFIGVVKVADLVPGNINLLSWDIPLINLPDVAIPSGSNSYVYFGGGLISPTLDGNSPTVNASEGYQPLNLIPLKFNKYSGDTNSIEVEMGVADGGAITSEQINSSMTSLANSFSITEIPVYIMTNPVLDGDNMRGPYAGIKLTSTNSASPFELYAINVDYEKTKLDGSLG
tara:strand:- start:223 stop:1158 length:936 start_codon:yes stop_codon:yes gene_type:complete